MRYIQIGDLKIGQGSKITFTEINGLSGCTVRRDEITYIDTDGADLTEAFFNPREIEIKGYILAKTESELHNLKRKLSDACTPKAERDIYYFDGVQTYYAKAIGGNIPEFGKKPTRYSYFVEYIAYMIVPSFFFQSEDDIYTNLYSSIKLLTKESVLPCKFSDSVTVTDIVNDGGVKIYPKIVVECTTSNEKNIVITNETTGEYIEIKYIMSPGETLTIDMFERTVYNGSGENLNNKVTAESTFFGYGVGTTTIRTSAAPLYVYSVHRILYAGV